MGVGDIYPLPCFRPSSIPKRKYLIGWYKFNEDSGLVCENSATDGSLGGGPLPDLTVINAGGDFWSYLSGFGSTPTWGTGLENVAYADAGEERILSNVDGECSFGIFYRGVSVPPNPGSQYGLFHMNLINTSPANSNTVAMCPLYDGTNYRERLYWKINSAYNTGSPPGEWCFKFTDDQYYLCLVRADGTLIVGDQSSTMLYPITNRWIIVGSAAVELGVGGIYGAAGSYADFLIYNFSKLTRIEWGGVYDLLRSRYGMSARSGW